ncbi:hypothetical protein [Arthrobacter oryzae]|uniref:hypothetical protein n=1 Tax=Arthrobacter oryzae TaxID=409290 RepID=UPI0011CD641C|nr:hypothetical protein [Arthrobacter oryzae]
MTLERIIYKDLTILEELPDNEAEGYEPRILKKLERLDELQDRIDDVMAQLKEAGDYSPISHSGRVYEYMPPMVVRAPKPAKAKHVVYPVQAKAPKARKPKPAPKPKAPKQSKELWLAKKRRANLTWRMKTLDEAMLIEKGELWVRRAERQARVDLVANWTSEQNGPQLRRTAKIGLEKVQHQLDTLEERKAQKLAAMNVLLDQALADIDRLTKAESPTEKRSQLV